MPNFATVDDVRLMMQNDDAAIVPNAIIQRSIDDAHECILPLLLPSTDTEQPDPPLVRGEALLAAAYTLGALARGAAGGGYAVQLGGNRLEAGARFERLRRSALDTEAEAWRTLAPFLIPPPPEPPATATASQPVLGKD